MLVFPLDTLVDKSRKTWANIPTWLIKHKHKYMYNKWVTIQCYTYVLLRQYISLQSYIQPNTIKCVHVWYWLAH